MDPGAARTHEPAVSRRARRGPLAWAEEQDGCCLIVNGRTSELASRRLHRDDESPSPIVGSRRRINVERLERGDEFGRAVKDDPRFGPGIPTPRVAVTAGHVGDGRHEIVECLSQQLVGVVATCVVPRQQRSNEDARKSGDDGQSDVHDLTEFADAIG